MTITIRGGVLLAVPLALLGGVREVQAQAQVPAQAVQARQAPGRTFGFGVSAGASHSDNIARTPDNEQSDTSANIGVQAQISGKRNRLDSELSVNLEHRQYLDDTFPSDLVGGVNASLEYWITPERFSWVLEENFGQTSVEPRAVETPDNRQNTNYFSTGPELLVGIGSRTDLSLGARFSTSSFQESQADDTRLTGTVGVIRRLGTRSSLSLNDTVEKIEFGDEAFNDGYTRNSISLGFNAQGAKTTLTAQAGYTALYDFGESLDGPLFNISVVRELTARSSVTLNAGTSFTDSAEAFRRDQNLGGVLLENDDNVVTTDPFQSDFISLVWALRGTRTSMTITGDWTADDHVNLDELNRESIGARLALTRRLTSLVEGFLEGAWREQEFSDSGVDFSEKSVGLGVNWSVSRNFGLNLRGERFDGSGDTVGIFGSRDYSENRYSLSITYTPRR